MRKHPLGMVAATAVVACVSALTLAHTAPAAPTGIFRSFSQCPTAALGDAQCIAGEVVGGEMSLGAVRVPIVRPLLLRAGDVPVGYPSHPSEIEFSLLPPTSGEMISQTELEVPGGLQRFADVSCADLGRACKVTMTIEAMIGQSNRAILNELAFNEGKGAALVLPVRVHIHNPFLGNACYIGSGATPLRLHLTTGATQPPAGFKPLRGSAGPTETLEEKGEVALRAREAILVDNTFAAPGAEGCGAFRPLLDSDLKIPNRAGENAAVLDATLLIATSQAVLASEKW